MIFRMRYWINERNNVCLEFENDHHEYSRMMIMVNRGNEYFEAMATKHPEVWISSYSMQYMISGFPIQDNYDDDMHTIDNPIRYRSDEILLGQLKTGTVYRNHNPTLRLFKPLTIKQMDYIAGRIINGHTVDML